MSNCGADSPDSNLDTQPRPRINWSSISSALSPRRSRASCRRFPIFSADELLATQKVPRLDSKRRRELVNVHETDVPLTTLNAPDVRAVQSTLQRQRLL